MKKIVLYIIFNFSFILAYCQKHDYILPLGSKNFPNSFFGGTNIDYNFSPPKIYAIDRKITYIRAFGSMCNYSGKLLYQSNGCRIVNISENTMNNGSTINSGNQFKEYCMNPDEYINGYRLSQSIVNIPLGNNQYRMFHMGSEFYSKVPDYITDSVSSVASKKA